MIFRTFLIFLLIAFVEVYFFQAVKTITQDYPTGRRQLIHNIYWGLSVVILTIGLVAVFYPPPLWNKYLRNYLATFALLLALVKLIGIVFLVIDDVVRLVRWIITYFSKSESGGESGISRLKFLSYLSVTFAVVPFVGFMYGIFRGGFKYRVHKVKVSSNKLPQAFHGLKIVQLSDIHTGSFASIEPLEKAFKIAMDLKPDIIFFTGDLVNVQTDETDGFIDTYRKLQAPLGVYSILGNHDYGDYRSWNSDEEKKANLVAIHKVHEDSGWRLLINENVELEKDGDKIALIGVENWGGNMNFKKYGKLDQAYKGTEAHPFKILLSHDPSHWNMEVRKLYKDIDLTLSGHTHGFQLGIEIPGFKWSPVKYIYPQWAGLYQDENQYLYVNRGLGFIGYPGRVGIWPEITLLELEKA